MKFNKNNGIFFFCNIGKKTNETADSSPHNLEGYVRRN